MFEEALLPIASNPQLCEELENVQRSVEQVIGDDGTALGSAPVDALADAQVEYGDDAPLRGGEGERQRRGEPLA